MFMESLHRCRRMATLGGLEADRLQFARFRALREGFYIPTENLVRLGQAAIQQHPRIGALYSQSAGLVQWIMTTDQGQLQTPFLQ